MNLKVVSVDKEAGVVTVEAETFAPADFPVAIESLKEGLRVPNMAIEAAKAAGISNPTIVSRSRHPYPYFGEGVDQDELAKSSAEPISYRIDVPISSFSM
jgi:hypothetical protein